MAVLQNILNIVEHNQCLSWDTRTIALGPQDKSSMKSAPNEVATTGPRCFATTSGAKHGNGDSTFDVVTNSTSVSSNASSNPDIGFLMNSQECNSQDSRTLVLQGIEKAVPNGVIAGPGSFATTSAGKHGNGNSTFDVIMNSTSASSHSSSNPRNGFVVNSQECNSQDSALVPQRGGIKKAVRKEGITSPSSFAATTSAKLGNGDSTFDVIMNSTSASSNTSNKPENGFVVCNQECNFQDSVQVPQGIAKAVSNGVITGPGCFATANAAKHGNGNNIVDVVANSTSYGSNPSNKPVNGFVECNQEYNFQHSARVPQGIKKVVPSEVITGSGYSATSTAAKDGYGDNVVQPLFYDTRNNKLCMLNANHAESSVDSLVYDDEDNGTTGEVLQEIVCEGQKQFPSGQQVNWQNKHALKKAVQDELAICFGFTIAENGNSLVCGRGINPKHNTPAFKKMKLASENSLADKKIRSITSLRCGCNFRI
jgi:hypothetical protein